MAKRFPTGELIFDGISKLAVKVGNRRAKKAGAEVPFWKLAIGDPIKQILKWSDKIKIIDWFTMWARTPLNPKWSQKTLKMIKRTERLRISKIIHIKFNKY